MYSEKWAITLLYYFIWKPNPDFQCPINIILEFLCRTQKLKVYNTSFSWVPLKYINWKKFIIINILIYTSKYCWAYSMPPHCRCVGWRGSTYEIRGRPCAQLEPWKGSLGSLFTCPWVAVCRSSSSAANIPIPWSYLARFWLFNPHCKIILCYSVLCRCFKNVSFILNSGSKKQWTEAAFLRIFI